MTMSRNAVMDLVGKKFERKDLPKFNVGDSIKMMIRVNEGDKTRLHPFEGTVISKVGSGSRATFSVRKISFGEGVERIFPMHTPVIESLKVISKGVVRTSKLYYLRTGHIKRGKIKKEQSAQESVAAVAQAKE